jgi:hypothetical protein
MVDRWHLVVDVRTETDAGGDGPSALLEVRAGMSGADHDPRPVQALDGGQRPGQLGSQGDQPRASTDEDVDLFRRRVGDVLADVGAPKRGVDEWSLNMRAKDSRAARFRCGTDRRNECRAGFDR